MRSHCALYVDAGYLLASAATRATGTSLRSGIEVDHRNLIEALSEHAERVSGLPLLRTHWYDSSRQGTPDAAHETIGLLPRVKLRLGRIGYGGEQKGVDLRIGLDMVAHARNGAVDVIFLVSGDDDLTEAVEEAQAQGVQVLVLAIPDASGEPHGVSRHLQRAADGLEMLEPMLLDASVKKNLPVPAPRQDAGRSSAPDAEPATPLNVPSPAQLANQVRAATPAATRSGSLPDDPAPTAVRTALVYSISSGSAPVVMMDGGHSPDEVDEIIDRVTTRVLESWLQGATYDQRQELVEGRPSIPPDVDRALLVDLSEALGVYELSHKVRIRLRARFWERLEEGFPL